MRSAEICGVGSLRARSQGVSRSGRSSAGPNDNCRIAFHSFKRPVDPFPVSVISISPAIKEENRIDCSNSLGIMSDFIKKGHNTFFMGNCNTHPPDARLLC